MGTPGDMRAGRQDARRRAAGLQEEIAGLRKKWGKRLVILTHHYQRPEIVRCGDVAGDSFQLAQEAASREEVEHIVFCGVLFMAEAAAVVARPGQRVYHPNQDAGCPLADHADGVQVERALGMLEQIRGRDAVMPVTYMNSDVAVKAVVGKHGGTVCTSSNAPRAFGWALERRPAVLFMPDEHLGRNTAEALSIPDEEVALWDPWKPDVDAGRERLARARVILWRGHCHVHTWFRADHVDAAREQDPGALVYVHPECRREVVRKADGAGSTRYLVQTAAEAHAGATLVIGTEINLVTRLAMDHPDKRILPLARSLCPNMFRITLARLRDTLAGLPDTNPVRVDEDVRENAHLALQRMLDMP